MYQNLPQLFAASFVHEMNPAIWQAYSKSSARPDIFFGSQADYEFNTLH